MKPLIQQILFGAACFIFTLADDFWSVDENTLPESLPWVMQENKQVYFSEEDIGKAVFWAYKIQNDVVSEHNGHVFDTESPLSHFEDFFILPKTRVSSTDSDVVFENNTITGLTNHNNNKVVIKWSEDQVYTKVTWNELQIAGKYTFFDNLRYTNGKYLIVIENVMYQANTPLSKNIELYPLSAPNMAVSYGKFKTVFTGDHSISDEFFATRYFLEQVAFRHVADHAMATMRKNVTSAIRAAARPYVLYKNRSDPHFPGARGRLDDGREFVVSDPFADGLDKAVQKVRAVWPARDAGAVIVFAENTLYDLGGNFELRVLERRDGAAGRDGGAADVNATGTAVIAVGFAVDRVLLNVEYDALGPGCHCTTAVQVFGMTAWPEGRGNDRGAGDPSGICRQAAEAFVEAVREHLAVGTCTAIVNTNKYGRGMSCPAPPSRSNE